MTTPARTLVPLVPPRTLAAAVAIIGAPAAQRATLAPSLLARADAVLAQHRACMAEQRRQHLTRARCAKSRPLGKRALAARARDAEYPRLIGRVPGVQSEEDMTRRLKAGKVGSNGCASMNASAPWVFGAVKANGPRYAAARAAGRAAKLNDPAAPLRAMARAARREQKGA